MQAQTNINSFQVTTSSRFGINTISCLKIITLCYLGLFTNLALIMLIALQANIPVAW